MNLFGSYVTVLAAMVLDMLLKDMGGVFRRFGGIGPILSNVLAGLEFYSQSSEQWS
jgi:hypothetical protein